MSALINTVTRVGAGAWEYAWSGTAPFTVYSDGVAVLQESDATSVVMQWTDDDSHVEPPPIEVIDSTGDVSTMQQAIYPPQIVLQFRGRTTNLYYVVQQYDGAAWQTVCSIHEIGVGYYRATVRAQPTGSYQFRVTPYDESGSVGTPLQYTLFHHTNPAPPELTYIYDAGTGLVTVDNV